MFAGGSQQLRIFRRARRDGASIEAAAEVAGIGLGEARLTAVDDDKNPPPPEAFELLGHNHPPKGPTMAEAADDRLRTLVERIERLEEEKKGIADDIKEVFGEAKATGYDVAIIRKVLKLRKIRADLRAEMNAVLDTYCCALGIQLDLPLAVAA